MKITSVVAGFVVATFADSSLFGAEDPTAQNRFFVTLPPPLAPSALLVDSPFGTEKILQRVPFDCFDIICFHPYRNPNAPEDRFDWWVLDQYVKRFHKSDLTPDYPLVRMSFLEQTDELLKVTSTPLCLPTIQQARTRWCSGVRGPLPMCASTIPSRD